jgi:hypothetical protein
MPLPPGLGISTLRTGEGLYVQLSSSAFSRSSSSSRRDSNAAMVTPSTPGAPLFFFTFRKPALNHSIEHSSSKSLRSSVNRSLRLISLFSLHGSFANQCTDDSADAYVSAIRRLPCGLISDPQSLMCLQFRLRVPPFTSASLALTRCFTLTDVTAGSQAPGFTITTASSAGPRPITDHVSASLRA